MKEKILTLIKTNDHKIINNKTNHGFLPYNFTIFNVLCQNKKEFVNGSYTEQNEKKMYTFVNSANGNQMSKLAPSLSHFSFPVFV